MPFESCSADELAAFKFVLVFLLAAVLCSCCSLSMLFMLQDFRCVACSQDLSGQRLARNRMISITG